MLVGFHGIYPAYEWSINNVEGKSFNTRNLIRAMEYTSSPSDVHQLQARNCLKYKNVKLLVILKLLWVIFLLLK